MRRRRTMRGGFLMRLAERRRSETERDQGSALIMVLALVAIMAALALSLGDIIVLNSSLTTLTQSRGKSVYTAEAGLESALGRLREAAQAPDPSGKIYGDPSQLPCTITGTVDGDPSSQDAFSVTIGYFHDDPTSHATASAADQAWRSANALSCSETTGLAPDASPASLDTVVPYYALIQSTGATSSDSGGRTLEAVYVFDIDSSTTVAAGGEILVYGMQTYCLRAESATAGAMIDYATGASCDRSKAANAGLLGWTYDSDYKIRLASQTPVDDPSTPQDESAGGLCIAGPVYTGIGAVYTTSYAASWSYTINGIGPKSITIGTTNTPPTMPASPPATISNFITVNRSSANATLVAAGHAGAAVQGTPTTNPAGTVTTEVDTTPWTGVQYKYATPPSSTQKTYTATAFSYVVTKTTTKTVSNGTPTTVAELADCTTGIVATDGSGNITADASQNDLLWQFNGGSTWNNVDNYCLWSGSTAHTPSTSSKLSVVTPCDGTQDSYHSFAPEAKVGAGNASVATQQLVNFQEFGRCIDATNAKFTSSDQILYPCKQDAVDSPPKVDQNQQFYYTEPSEPAYAATTTIYGLGTSSGGINGTTNTKWCMKDPAQNAAQPAYVTFSTTCTGTNATWTRYTWTGRYESSYIFLDQYGRCLTADSAHPDPITNAGWSTLTVAGCNGSASQKWNAPPDLPDGGLGDYREIPTTDG